MGIKGWRYLGKFNNLLIFQQNSHYAGVVNIPVKVDELTFLPSSIDIYAETRLFTTDYNRTLLAESVFVYAYVPDDYNPEPEVKPEYVTFLPSEVNVYADTSLFYTDYNRTLLFSVVNVYISDPVGGGGTVITTDLPGVSLSYIVSNSAMYDLSGGVVIDGNLSGLSLKYEVTNNGF